ncbi:hypothetical protein TNIN_481391 [Trichonephila inaurata madagascariensis]|uniref:Uncharacterized protein n=1 Tax=Trichonephila inaurata madagascariensis TaxID=2747483 RepID=A0A8X6XND8_9ARAC|nr:hypothetical protein TNIN_481391 [Trichonephila inaurata madagascariensis]
MVANLPLVLFLFLCACFINLVPFFRSSKTYCSQACNNFVVIHPVQASTEKKIDELLNTAYFYISSAGNAVNGFKECGIELHDLQELSCIISLMETPETVFVKGKFRKSETVTVWLQYLKSNS